MEHLSDLAERIGTLLFDSESSDMTFTVEGESLPAHRAIISTACDHFRSLLQENLKDPIQNEIVLNDVPRRGFKLLMSYIYTGQLNLKEIDEEAILEVLEIAKSYALSKLQSSLSQSLEENLAIENVCMIFNKALELSLEGLSVKCRLRIMKEPTVFLRSDHFCDLSEEALRELLTSIGFCADEIEIFRAVVRWCAKHPTRENPQSALDLVRLPLIETKDLVTTVKDSGLFTPDVILDAIRMKECRGADVDFRGICNHEELPNPDIGALMLTERHHGNCVRAGTSPCFESKKMPKLYSKFTFHASAGLVVALGQSFVINFIGFLLCDQFEFMCSYYVEVSVNLVDWVRVIDHSKHTCHSWQMLCFNYRPVRYIRLICTAMQPQADVLELASFKVRLFSKTRRRSCGFSVPETNEAHRATIGGCLDDSDALLRTKTEDDQGKFEWSSHEIGKGSIMIHLTQPFTVGSMRLRLRDDDSHAYLYFIETSLDKENWTRVADHTVDLCRSWQNITFEERPVLYIKIVGTASTLDEYFSCARFECPATEPAPVESPAKQNEVKSGATNTT